MKDRDAVIITADDASQSQRRRIKDLPEDMSPGAREVALLTAVTKAQASTIKPMGQALLKLRELGPDIWPCRFLVADKAVFDWRTAPWRSYTSLDDFYNRELAPIYGSYDSFIRDVEQLMRGQLSPEDAVTNARRRGGQPGNRNAVKDKTNVDNIHNRFDDRPSGTSEKAALRRLHKDRPDLHAAVLNSELSPHAAMIKAGFRPHTFTVRDDDAAKIAATLRRQLKPDILHDVAKLITEDTA